jgi:hypothetical protein
VARHGVIQRVAFHGHTTCLGDKPT